MPMKGGRVATTLEAGLRCRTGGSCLGHYLGTWAGKHAGSILFRFAAQGGRQRAMTIVAGPSSKHSEHLGLLRQARLVPASI